MASASFWEHLLRPLACPCDSDGQMIKQLYIYHPVPMNSIWSESANSYSDRKVWAEEQAGEQMESIALSPFFLSEGREQ